MLMFFSKTEISLLGIKAMMSVSVFIPSLVPNTLEVCYMLDNN